MPIQIGDAIRIDGGADDGHAADFVEVVGHIAAAGLHIDEVRRALANALDVLQRKVDAALMGGCTGPFEILAQCPDWNAAVLDHLQGAPVGA